MTEQEKKVRIDTSIDWEKMAIEKESQVNTKGLFQLSRMLNDLEKMGKMDFTSKICQVGENGLNLSLPSGKVSIAIHDCFDSDGDLISSGSDAKRDIVLALVTGDISQANIIITSGQQGQSKRVGCTIRFKTTWFDGELSASGLQNWINRRTKGIKAKRQGKGKTII